MFPLFILATCSDCHMFRFLALRPRGSTWIWSDGRELSYENWGPDQPVAGHACVRMRDDGMWYTEDSEVCDRPSASICLYGRYNSMVQLFEACRHNVLDCIASVKH